MSQLEELGRRLFTDPGLSSTGTVACSSCHLPDRAFANGDEFGRGVHGRTTRRNPPSLLNVAFRPLLQWDGYASSLENFAKYPLSGHTEMNFHYLDRAADYVRSRFDYRQAFGSLPGRQEIEFDGVARALAAYQRTLLSGNSGFDRYKYGGDQGALSPAAERGHDLFVGRARCATCHSIGPTDALLTDFAYHDLGIGYDASKGRYRDLGLGGISTDEFSGLFLTPSLRNVALTAPYMHDGSLHTLAEVVAFYSRGGNRGARRPEIVPVGLRETEQSDLIAFLESLTGDHAFTRDGRRIVPAAATNSLRDDHSGARQ
jgi:cytochrome c peroxidase